VLIGGPRTDDIQVTSYLGKAMIMTTVMVILVTALYWLV